MLGIFFQSDKGHWEDTMGQSAMLGECLGTSLLASLKNSIKIKYDIWAKRPFNLFF